MSRKITIVFFDAGGGHRNAAEALKSVLESQPRSWQVDLLNLQELLDRLDILKKLTGIRIQDGYNLILRKGWTRLTPQLLPLLQGVVRLYHKPTVKLLEEYWKNHPANVVVSVIPHFNRALAESIAKSRSSAAFVTIITDMADYPPHFWIERESQFIIAGTEKAQQQALAYGHDRQHVFLASGMVLKPKFYVQRTIHVAQERKKLGLDPNTPTGIVLFGGHGSNTILEIVRRLSMGDSRLQLMVICGKNEKLLNAVKRTQARFPVFVEGFTHNMDFYMALSDFFIGKPGPGSISEALQFNLPVIVECNGRTLPQERYNAQWVTEKQLGIVLKSFRQINEGVQKLLEPAAFRDFRANARAYQNRALFEIPEFLEQIVERHGHALHGLGAAVPTATALQRAAWSAVTSQMRSEWAT